MTLIGGLSVALPLASTGAAATAADNPPARAESFSTEEIGSASATVISVAPQVYRLLVEVEGAIKGGTAFLVSGKRVVATNYHVVEQGTAYSAGYIGNGGRVERVPLRLLAVFPQKDLALLEALDDLPGDALSLADGYPALATDLFAFGFPAAADPQGLSSWAQGEDQTFFLPSVLKGYVSRVLTNRWFSSQLQHQTPIIPGYSGGPLIDGKGVVLAVSSSIHKEANGISYGVLARDLADFLTACSLPAKLVKRGSHPLVSSNRAQEPVQTANTHAVQKIVPPDPADEAMLARGNELLERGDIEAARLMFRYLVKRRSLPAAYEGLAKTYDPAYLHYKNAIGVVGDAGKAQEYYEIAASLGGLESLGREGMAGLPGNDGCNGSFCRLVNGARGPSVVCEQGKTALSGREGKEN